jgi:hypothetical protein
MTDQQFDHLVDLIAWYLPENYPSGLREVVDFETTEELDQSQDGWSLAGNA